METVRVPIASLCEGVPHKVMLGETPIVLIRQGEAVCALSGSCPHAGAPLEEAAVCGGRLVCPWHKAVFAIADGSVLEPPALAPLARYVVRIDGGDAVLDGTEAARADARAGSAGTIAIVGTGAAASGALALLRLRGHAGRVVLIGPEAEPPYDRTVLSKMVIGGGMPPAAKPVLEGSLGLAVERVRGVAVRVDAQARAITLDDGSVVGYDQALVATGGTPKLPGLPGEALGGVHVLRSVADAAALVSSIESATRAVVLGAGFIGLEVASGLRERGIPVTVVSGGSPPLGHVLGEAVGRRLQALHEEKGVVFRAGQIAGFEGDGRVSHAVLQDGTRLGCDLVVLGTGISPNTGLLEGSEEGIVVDGSLRAAPGLFAAGDIARFPLGGETVRIEHWRLAQQHGWLAARNMLGETAAFEGVPFFWTAQHGVRLDYLGYAEAWDEEVIEGDLDGLDFVALLGRGGRVAAAVGCARDTQMARLSDAMRRPLSMPEARATVG